MPSHRTQMPETLLIKAVNALPREQFNLIEFRKKGDRHEALPFAA
jgi:hypothetical protein